MPKSLSTRLVLTNLLILVVGLIVLIGLVYGLVRQRMLTELDGRLRLEAVELNRMVRLAPATSQPLEKILFDRRVTEPEGEPVILNLLDGQTGQALYSAGRESLELRRADFEAARRGQKVLRTTPTTAGQQFEVLTFGLYDAQDQLLAVGQVGQSLATIEQVGLTLLAGLGLAGLLVSIMAYGVGYWLTRRALRPLELAANTMHDLSAHQLQIRLETSDHSTEVQRLTQAFNQLMGRLEASFQLQQAFVADVSHELRTPLTAIRGQLDVQLLNPALDSEVRQDLEQAQAELQRLSRLVSNLLACARAEAGMSPQLYPATLQVVELDVLLVEVAHQARYLKRQVGLEIEQLEQITTKADPDLLKQLLFNLVDNALTYTPGGQRVSLSLSRQADGWAVLTISDCGPGIMLADLPHIFERHYQANRPTTQSKTGAGLGLYIANMIVQAHGGNIKVNSQPGQGACFSVHLPVNQEGSFV